MNVFRGIWSSNFTFDCRYGKTGVTKRVMEYVERTDKKNLDIMDVGCSIAVALRSMQEELEKNDIKVRTIGLDPSEEVRTDAEKNVDEFLPYDILKIESNPN
ncbi:MAG: hypothetical protein ACRD9Q_02005, partial [Nitrososphaeraceae archaeon]